VCIQNPRMIEDVARIVLRDGLVDPGFRLSVSSRASLANPPLRDRSSVSSPPEARNRNVPFSGPGLTGPDGPNSE